MKTIKKRILILVGVLSLSLWFSAVPSMVFAASNSMTVSPPKQRIILIPGEKYSNTISVFNASDSTRDLKYEVSVGSFSQKKDGSNDNIDDYGAVDVVSESSYNQIMQWITLDRTSGQVAPGKTEDITYVIDVPDNAPAGGQYATIIVADVTTSNNSGGGNVMIDQQFQFASIIYAEVAGETKEDGVITDNNIPSFLMSSPLQASSLVRNNGNVHTDAEYTLQVWPLFSDEELCTNEEKPETSLILPDTERYHVQTCDLPSFGVFRAKQTVKIFGETSEMERTIIVCPLWLLFLILFVIIGLIIWIFARVKKGRERKSSVSSSSEE